MQITSLTLDASRAGVDVITEARRAADGAHRASEDAERWCRLALRADTWQSAARWADLAQSASLRAAGHHGEALALAPGAAATDDAARSAHAAEMWARSARQAADAMQRKEARR